MSQPEKDPSPQPDSQQFDLELSAIQSVMAALSALKDDARQRVIDYVFRRLGLAAPVGAPSRSPLPPENAPPPTQPPQASAENAVTDIRTLKEKKQPRSAIEMAVLVAYYLSEIATAPYRKSEIGTEDINTYFKQADYPIPGRPRKTLFDAKAAGYLDSPTQGAYRLNPVGHNLIAHGLPGKAADSKRGNRKQSQRKRASRKSGKKVNR